MAHTFHGKRANIFFNAQFDKRDHIEIIDKETGDTVKIDVDDLLNFLETEYYEKQEKENQNKKAIVLFTNNHMRYYIESVINDSLEQVKKELGKIDIVIDETEDYSNYTKVQEELHEPTTKHGDTLAVVHWLD